MQFIAVDWSGNAREGHKHTWIAVVRDGELMLLENGHDRAEVAKFLHAWAFTFGVDRTVVGLDFAFSMPEWFLRKKKLGSAHELWELASREGERWLAESPPPFWGRKGTHPPEPALRWRANEISIPSTAGISPKSVFQIAGAGAVGTGTIRGLWLLANLNRGFSIWPFDPPGEQLIVEIHPRLLTGPVKKSDQAHRAAYLDSDRWKMTDSLRALAASTEDAFDAAISALVMAEHEEQLANLVQAQDRITLLEGQIWYPPDLPAHVWAVPAGAPAGRSPVLEIRGETAPAARPFPRSFWVEPGQLLAGAYPGDKDPDTASAKLNALRTAGIRHIVNLTDPNQPGHDGGALRPYVSEAQDLGISVARWPVRDVSIPSEEGMTEILNDIDLALANGRAVYVHCWGARGRTATVVGCWLVRHGASPDEALVRLQALSQQLAMPPSPTRKPELNSTSYGDRSRNRGNGGGIPASAEPVVAGLRHDARWRGG